MDTLTASITNHYTAFLQQLQQQALQSLQLQQEKAADTPISPVERMEMMVQDFDVLLGIFSFLSVYDLCHLCPTVCKSWYTVAEDNELWRYRVLARYVCSIITSAELTN